MQRAKTGLIASALGRIKRFDEFTGDINTIPLSSRYLFKNSFGNKFINIMLVRMPRSRRTSGGFHSVCGSERRNGNCSSSSS